MATSDELLTRVDRRRARSSVPHELASTTTVRSALARERVLRTRAYIYMGLVVGGVGLIVVPALPGGYWETRILIFAIVVAIIAQLYLLRRLLAPETFHSRVGTIVTACVGAVVVSAAVLYFGPYSPAPVLLVLAIYFTALSETLPVALALYLACALTQGITSLFAIAGIGDPGIFHGDYLPATVRVIVQLLIQLILAATFLVARASQRSQLIAISELEAATRAVAQREALLAEARDELRRALGGGRGRFTEQTIGNYRLGELIGRGAMGEVYDGVDARTGESVAVKMLSQSSLGNAQHVQRFLRELRTAAMLRSPNIVRVLEVGDEPLPHLVMERLRGRDLSSILRDKRVLDDAELVDLIRQIGAGITAAGEAGVIHRDLKPQNVFLDGRTWKILDFGVARATDSGDTLTAGHAVGTPSYMAPEQAAGGEVSHASDLYALAAIAYRCITGHGPYAAGEIHDMLYRIVHSRPRRPSSLAKVSAELEGVLAIGLARDPRDRFATAGELADAFAEALAGRIARPLRLRALRASAWA
jgi:serine/threonine-protein kinase